MMNNILELMIRRSRQATPSVPSDYVFYAPLSSTSPLEDETGKELVYNGTMTAEVVDGIPCVFMPCESDINHSYLLTNDTTGISTGNQSITMSVWFKRYSLSQIGEWEVVFAAGYPSPYQVPLFGYHQGYVYYSTYSYDIFTTIPADLLWHHYALRYDSNTSTFSLFVDNELVKQTIAESKYNFPTGNKQIILNAQAIGNGDFPKGGGHYASAYIYDRALSDAEIGMLYNEHGNSSDVSDSSSSGSDISDSSSSGSDISDSSSSGGGDPTLVWYTPFTTDYTEIIGNVTGVPTSSGICEIVSDSRFGGYLNMHKYSGGNLTGLQFPETQNALQLGTSDWTMSFWLNAPQWNNYGQAIISHRGNGTGFDNKDGFVLFKDSNYTMDMRIGANSNQAKSSDIPTDDTWHNWVFIHYSDGEWEWYMDGEYVEGGSGWGGNATSNGNVNVFVGGDGDWGKSAVFKLCHLRIYNRYLEYEEIEDMYHEFDESSDSSSSMSDSSSSISDLIFHAPFTTDLSDIAGNRTATPTDSGAADVTITTKDGKSCVYVPNNARLLYSPCGDVPLGNTSKSMSIWVNMDFTNSGWNGIFAVGENSRYKLFMLSTNNSWKVSYGGSWNDVYSTSQLHSGWNHMAVTYDTTAIKLYHDGVLVHTSQQSDKVDTAETNICVGGRPAASDNYCESAWFSDARIYSRALTDAEILSIYQEGL